MVQTVTIETRCTQCGSPNTNTLRAAGTNHGGGRAHGAETVTCLTCSDTCSLDECRDDDPCERCRVETVQNRRGSSVPRNNQ